MKIFSPTIYQKLQKKKEELQSQSLASLFEKDSQREEKLTCKQDGVLYDFSKNILDAEVLQLFQTQSQAINLQEKIEKLYQGKTRNTTENTFVSHLFLRAKKEVTQEMKNFASLFYQQKLLGSTGKPIENIVNLGIGGSHIGVKMLAQALGDSKKKVFFFSHYSGKELTKTLPKLSAEKTLFLVCSKSFGTAETLANAHLARNWLKKELGEEAAKKQLIAITSNPPRALDFGILEENIFAIESGIGGRFSISSNMALSLACLIGVEKLEQLFEGFRLADKNFLTTPLLQNIPVLMAWIGIWNRNFLEIPSLAILPYALELEYLPFYLQQLEMESGGKDVDLENKKIQDYNTSPIVFGQVCSDAQHSFFQLLHQGSEKVASDFIGFVKTKWQDPEQKIMHQKLLANLFAQQYTLAFGRQEQKIFQSLTGNKPSSCLLFDELNPCRLGQLIAIYEHKVFVQGIFWNICSFDQWGVEYGKKMAEKILPSLQEKKQEKILGLQKQIDFYYE